MNSPFNEEKFNSLLEGLEITILNLSELENQTTIGAEFYSKHFVDVVSKIKNSDLKFDTFSNLTTIVTDGDHGKTQYEEGGVLYLLSESIKEGRIDLNVGTRYISEELNKELKRSELNPGDVVVTKTGVYFGKSAVVPQEITRANTSAHVAKISPIASLNPYYLSTFLNSKMGYSQLRRRGIKVSRPEIKLIEFQDILVSLPSIGFQNYVEKLIKNAHKFLHIFQQSFKNADKILLENLGFNRFTLNDEHVSIKRFSSVFSNSARLDSEYYQLKYDQYQDKIKSYSNGFEPFEDICNLRDKNYKPNDKEEYKYIELANIGKSGEITDCTIEMGEDLPTRARRKVKTNDVIISSIEGSLDSCALVTPEYDNALCSTGFYVVNSQKINPETLLVLFKSEPIQNLLKKGCSGTILTAINKSELQKIPIPLIDKDTQKKIKNKVVESFELRNQSNHLLDVAKRAVEIAIEKDEKSALEFIKSEVADKYEFAH